MVLLELPYPPSVNKYWRHTGSRVLLSRQGRQYRETVATVVFAARVQPELGRLGVHIELYVPDKRRRDLDNVLKALLDALEHAGVYADDSQIDELCIKRAGQCGRGLARVQIWRLL